MKIKNQSIIGNIVFFVSLLLISCGDIQELESEQMNSSTSSELKLAELKLELTSLIINSSEVIVNDKPHISEYTMYVNNDVDKAELIAVFTKNAEIIINGVESSGKEILELKTGTNQFEIHIKNGLEMRGYHLVLIRKSI